jgi:hypothetical protein
MLRQLRGAAGLYRAVLLVSILLNLAIGLFIIFEPNAFTDLLSQPEASPKTWPRYWGFQLLDMNAVYLPGLRDPVGHRWSNWIGILIRLAFAFFFLQGDGFVPMGVYDGLLGLPLLATYVPVVRSARSAA